MLSKNTFEFKSMVIGFLCGVVFLLLIGLKTPPQEQVGRFQMEANNNHAFIIDTATGEVWEKFTSPNSGSTTNNFSRKKIEMKDQ